MCGLVGLAGDITFKEEKIFKDLLLLDAIRGKHSTGVASLNKLGNDWNVSVVKDKLNSIDYMDLPEFNTLMGKKHYILMGHNRHATRGSIIKENAHPFEFDKLVGAHNGSLVSTYSLHEHTKYQVDSQAAFSEMNENGVASLWGKLNGAAALTWIDKTDNTVHFLRNDERPLWFTTMNKGRTLIWASEFWMLHVACGRQGGELDAAPREVLVNQHYTFTVPLLAGSKDVVTHTKEAVQEYVAPKWTSKYSDGYDRYYSDYNKGKKYLEKENAKEWDEVEFTVDTIKDHPNGVATVFGKTLKGSPVRLFNVDTVKHEDLIMEMWESNDMVFKGKISYSAEYGLAISIYTTECCQYTLSDIAAASEESDGEVEQLPDGVKYHHITYKIGCSYCRKLTSSYYSSPHSHICCEECWDEEVSKLTAEERSKLEPGFRYNKRLN